MLKNIFAACAMFFFIVPVYSWSGYDWETSSYVDIEKGNTVRRGREVEVYDWGEGEYKTYEVERVRSLGHQTEVELYDWNTGDTRILDMNNY